MTSDLACNSARTSPKRLGFRRFVLAARGTHRVVVVFMACLAVAYLALLGLMVAASPIVAVLFGVPLLICFLGYVDLGAAGFERFANRTERLRVRRLGQRFVGRVRVLAPVGSTRDIAAVISPRSDDERCFLGYLGEQPHLPLAGFDPETASRTGEFLIEHEGVAVRIDGQQLLTDADNEVVIRDGDFLDLMVITEGMVPMPDAYRAARTVHRAARAEQVLIRSIKPRGSLLPTAS